jgi:hypothetical protein
MTIKNIGDKILSEVACTMCNLGILDPKEAYTNSKGEFIPTPLLSENCKSCSTYEQLLRTNTPDNYIQKKD